MPIHCHPSESSKKPRQQPLFVPPPIENQDYNRHRTCPLRPSWFDPILMAYTELLPYLIQRSLVFSGKLNPLVTCPPNFKHNVICVYHGESSWHTTENYKAFKYRVQELNHQKILSFADSTDEVKKPAPWSYNITTHASGNTKDPYGVKLFPLLFIF